MSSAQGFPDWQRITQWLGPPIDQQTALVIGAGAHASGPFQVSNFASVLVALKATGGPVTVTIKQTVPAGPASLLLSQSVVVAAGATLFEAFVLFAGAVELDLQGAIAGTSVDYALYGSNTTTNAQVITAATINVQHNDVLVAAEPTLDLEDAGANVWAVADDAPNTRVKITPPRVVVGIVDSTGAIVRGSGFTVVRGGVGDFTVTFAPAFAAAPVVVAAIFESLGNNAILQITGITAAVFGVRIFSSNLGAGTPLDNGFTFIVHPT